MYEAHPNGIIKSIVRDFYENSVGFEIEFGVTSATKEEIEKNYFKTWKEAYKRRAELPKELMDTLLVNDEWVHELFKKYQADLPKPYWEVMKKVIKIKLNIDV